MLYVYGRNDRDAVFEQIKNILVSLSIFDALDVAVGKLIDNCHRGLSPDDGRDIHFLKDGPAILDLYRRNDLKVLDLLLRFEPPVCLDRTDDHVYALLF